MFHIFLHFALPLLIAVIFFKSQWQKAYLLMLAGLLIDIDHLLATPIYDPNRCSVGFHPLHTAIPIALYVLALIPQKTRIVAIGLCFHIVLDSLDCWL